MKGFTTMVYELTPYFFFCVVTISDDFTLQIKTHQFILLIVHQLTDQILKKCPPREDNITYTLLEP